MVTATAFGTKHGLAFEQICKLSLINGPEEEIMERQSQISEPTFVIATHSMGGREWEHSVPDVLFNGAFLFLRESQVRRIYAESASSGTAIEFVKTENGWDATLYAVADGDGYYKCTYWEMWHELAVEPRDGKAIA